MKAYYEQDGSVIYHGDAMEIIPTLSFDLVITSPPYNLGAAPWAHLGNWKPGDASGSGSKSKWRNGSDAGGGIIYGTHTDAMPWPEYVAWQRSLLSLLWSKLPDNGAIFYNHKPRVVGAKLWTPMELLPAEVALRQIIIWARPGGLNFNPTAFVPTHEWIMLLAKEAFRLKSKGVSGLGDVWSMTPDTNSHPAPFPLALPSRAIESTGPGVVIDPHCGSGTTLFAAKLAGRRAIGIDIDERFCELAANLRRIPMPIQDSLNALDGVRIDGGDGMPCDAGLWINWVIVGGESGPGARRCDVDWIRSIIHQCKQAGVPVFCKQLGANVIDVNRMRVTLKDSKGGDPSEWSEDLRIRQMPNVEAPTCKP